MRFSAESAAATALKSRTDEKAQGRMLRPTQALAYSHKSRVTYLLRTSYCHQVTRGRYSKLILVQDPSDLRYACSHLEFDHNIYLQLKLWKQHPGERTTLGVCKCGSF